MNSAIYAGIVRHKRLHLVLHQFSYLAFMMYLDLDELDRIFSKSLLWSTRRPALARYRRKDFLRPETLDLKQAVLDWVFEASGERPDLIRLWDYYLAYCQGGFMERVTHTAQIVMAKPQHRMQTLRARIPK